jgi:hypothetical protein
MDTITGIFELKTDAALAAAKLRSVGFGEDNITLLTPGSSKRELDTVPTEEAEQPGMGKAIGAVTGGAVGLAAGTVLANLLLPGVGLVAVLGLGAGSLGAAAGATGGEALESLLSRGMPKDEIFFYEDALRAGRTVLIAMSDDESQIATGRGILASQGAESLDAAREKWWIGLRDAEDVGYDGPSDISKSDENIYRCGFEVAQEPGFRGKTLRETQEVLCKRFPDLFDKEAFRRGYTEGQAYSLKFTTGSTEQTKKN